MSECRARRVLALGAVWLALAALILSGATVPHTHEGAEPGLHNQEHDFGLLAASGSIALLVVVLALPLLAVTASVVVRDLAWAPPAHPRHAASRAPPAPWWSIVD